MLYRATSGGVIGGCGVALIVCGVVLIVLVVVLVLLVLILLFRAGQRKDENGLVQRQPLFQLLPNPSPSLSGTLNHTK
jgi:uncharacterized membrane protein